MLLVNIVKSSLPDEMMDGLIEVQQDYESEEFKEFIRSSKGDPVKNHYITTLENVLEVSKKCREFISHVERHEKELILNSKSTVDRAHELRTELQNSIKEFKQAYQIMNEKTRGTTEKESEP